MFILLQLNSFFQFVCFNVSNKILGSIDRTATLLDDGKLEQQQRRRQREREVLLFSAFKDLDDREITAKKFLSVVAFDFEPMQYTPQEVAGVTFHEPESDTE